MRLAIIDDHRLMSASLAAALESEGFDVLVPTLGSLAELKSQLETYRPHLALLDLALGDLGSGAALVDQLVALGAGVVVVSGTCDRSEVGRCLAQGASGWVPKTAPLHELVRAVKASAAGQPIIDEDEHRSLINQWRNRRNMRQGFEQLTRRESSVLLALMNGQSVEKFAGQECVSPATVRSQVRAILTKLGVNSQLEAVAAAREAGWPPGPA